MRTWSRHSRRALPTQRSANAFAFGARIGVLTTSRPSVRKTSSEGSTELRVSVPKQDMFVVEAFGDRQVPSLLGDPHGIGAAGHAGDVDSSRGDLDEEQDVQRLQQHGLYREEVARQHSPALCPKELAPCRTGAAWCRP